MSKKFAMKNYQSLYFFYYRGRPEDVSMIHQLFKVQFQRQTWYQPISAKSSISSHVRISAYRFYEFVTTRYTTHSFTLLVRNKMKLYVKNICDEELSEPIFLLFKSDRSEEKTSDHYKLIKLLKKLGNNWLY